MLTKSKILSSLASRLKKVSDLKVSIRPSKLRVDEDCWFVYLFNNYTDIELYHSGNKARVDKSISISVIYEGVRKIDEDGNIDEELAVTSEQIISALAYPLKVEDRYIYFYSEFEELEEFDETQRLVVGFSATFFDDIDVMVEDNESDRELMEVLEVKYNLNFNDE